MDTPADLPQHPTPRVALKYAKGGNAMRIVTYNIQFGRGKDGRVDLERIAAEVEGADLIAMQEVDRLWTRSGMVDQVAELVRLLPGYHWRYGPGIDLDLGEEPGGLDARRRQFGNLLLVRAPIVSSRNHLLPKIGFADQLSLQRSALEGVIACPSGPVRFYSVHLAHISSLERQRQAARIMEIHAEAANEGGAWSGGKDRPDWLADGPPPPMPGAAVLMGDFNMEPTTPEYEIIAGPATHKYGPAATLGGFADAWLAAGNDPAGGLTKPAETGDRRIDFVFVATPLAERIGAARIDDRAQGSDHQPLWVEIDL
ncbi:MAG: endonuclease/exonuclease/phosphatase family protein [Rhodospirillales bacterium]|jgi:endonuclease/exonuclease/phosphatase family metal-dependent hydrolase|nr:endonuclease/exonuclease/phosphatase family protein [Rhodospirillales bacterium]